MAVLRLGIVATACLLALISCSQVSFASNPVQIENTAAGTTSWQLTNPATNHEIEGYASSTSVNRGGQISFFVNTSDSSISLEIYRLGWYGGAGGRLMLSAVVVGTRQPIPSPNPTTGLIECRWSNPYVLNIPYDTDPTVWTSGVYVAKLTGSNTGKQSYILFVVRDDSRYSDFLFQSSVNTFQAYNNWGGKSLYDFNSGGTNLAARKVSFNRPYALGPQANAALGVGAGEFLTNIQPSSSLAYATGWEFAFLRFLEREGYDVTYSTDIDTHANGAALLNHKGILVVGHDEYWSWQQRVNITSARENGVSIGFFSGNTMYWQVRLEPSPADGAAFRTLVGYKGHALTEDPLYLNGNPSDDFLVTTNWRSAPVNRPEDALVGVLYGDVFFQGNIVISNASNWAFAGTGLSNGSSLGNLLGYEVDHESASSPPGTQQLAHSPYTISTTTNYSDMTTYTAASGATVFATGTIQWSWGLDDYGVPIMRPSALNTSAQQITRNVFMQFASTAPLTNYGPSATVTVSSQNTTTGQLGAKAVDGIVSGYPVDSTREWATVGQLSGAWIRLAWSSSIQISRVVLWDRPNLTDQVLGGTLSFSDGTTLSVGPLPNDATSGQSISFPLKTVTWVQFTVSSASGLNTGLAEMQVFGPASPALKSLSLTPSSEPGGTSANGTLSLNTVAPANGIVVALSSSNSTVATAPATAIVPAGSDAASFTVSTASVAVNTNVTISGTLGSSTQTAPLLVTAAGPMNVAGGAAVIVSSQNTSTGQLGSKAVDGVIDGYPGDYTKEWATVGQLAGAWIRLTWTTPVQITKVVLWDRPNLTDNVVAGTLTFSDGSSAPVGTLPNDASSDYTVSFSTKTVTWVQFTVTSAVGLNIGLAEIQVFGVGASAAVSSLTLNPTSVIGGGSSQGTVILSVAAPSGGAIVTLASSNAAATVPASVTVPSGAISATFPVNTSAVLTPTSAVISAAYNSTTQQATLTVNPVSLSSLTLNPSTVTGGSSSQGTVVLNAAAPSGSATVNLSSNNTAIATVPASVAVPAGSTSSTFAVSTTSVANNSTVTISANYGGVTQSAVLSVTTSTSSGDIALNATATVSSQNTSTGQLGSKAIDGIVDGYPGDYTKEWATVGQLAGAWIRLTWASPVTLGKIILHDRPNLTDNVLAGTLQFSDGSSINVGQLPNDGTGLVITFSARTVSWVQFNVTNAVGLNIGLAEFEVY